MKYYMPGQEEENDPTNPTNTGGATGASPSGAASGIPSPGFAGKGGNGNGGGGQPPPPTGTPSPQAAPGDNQAQTGGAGPQAQGVGTGFNNLQSLLDANQSGAQGMAQGMYDKANAAYGTASNDIAQAKSTMQGQKGQNPNVDNTYNLGNSYDYGKLQGEVSQAQQYASALSQGGSNAMGALLQDQYGKTGSSPYTQGANSLDAFLTGQVAPGMSGYGNWGDLGKTLDASWTTPAAAYSGAGHQAPVTGGGGMVGGAKNDPGMTGGWGSTIGQIPGIDYSPAIDPYKKRGTYS